MRPIEGIFALVNLDGPEGLAENEVGMPILPLREATPHRISQIAAVHDNPCYRQVRMRQRIRELSAIGVGDELAIRQVSEEHGGGERRVADENIAAVVLVM